jgi:hypothetical protein
MGSKQTLPIGMEMVMELQMEMSMLMELQLKQQGRLFEMHALLERGWEEDKSIVIYNQMVRCGF